MLVAVSIFLCFIPIKLLYEHESDLYKRFSMGKMVDIGPYPNMNIYKKQAVATDRKECSSIGNDILKSNGTAIDASIASLLCLGVVNSHSSGIGGGGFFIIYSAKEKKVKFLNFRETAPSCSKPGMAHQNESIVSQGGLSVAVPGELRGYESAWKMYGNTKWKKLFEPAIKLSEEGFKVGASLKIALDKWNSSICTEESLRSIFCKDGKIPHEGDLVTNKKLAKTLKIISEYGSDAFYTGEMAQDISHEVKEKHGCVTVEDLKGYKTREERPISFKLGPLEIFTGGLPSSGPILSFMINLFKGYNMTAHDLDKRPVLVYHRLIETFKFAYSLRGKLGDPKFSKDVLEHAKNIISESFSAPFRNLISDNSTHPKIFYQKATYSRLKTGTTHLVSIDKFGNMVSVMSTVNGYFGAKFASKKYGFIYNNEMDDFSFPTLFNEYMLPPNIENFPHPRKQPLSSSSPAIVLDSNGNPVMGLGGSGGSIITTGIAQVLINHLIFGMTLKQAIDAPRLHTQLSPNIVFFEKRFPKNIVKELEEIGHKVDVNDIQHCVIQAIAKIPHEDEWALNTYRKQKIHKESENIYAESDYRKGGSPDGI